ncbi:MAG: hypothetical protein ACO3Z6_03035 [Pseudomonadales bacterium]
MSHENEPTSPALKSEATSEVPIDGTLQGANDTSAETTADTPNAAPMSAAPVASAPEIPSDGHVPAEGSKSETRFAALATAATAAAGETRKLWERLAPSRDQLAGTLQGLNARVSSEGKRARRVVDQVADKIGRRLELATVPSPSKLKTAAKQSAHRLQEMAQQIRVPDLATLRAQAGAIGERLHLAELTSSVGARLGLGKDDTNTAAKTSTKRKAPAKRKAAPRKSKVAASTNANLDAAESATTKAAAKKPTRTRSTTRKAASTGSKSTSATGTTRARRKQASPPTVASELPTSDVVTPIGASAPAAAEPSAGSNTTP